MKSLIKCIFGLFLINATYAPLDPDSVRQAIAPISVEWIDQDYGSKKPTITCRTNFCDAEIVDLPQLNINSKAITCPFIFDGRLTVIFNKRAQENIPEINEVEFRAEQVLLTLPGSTKHIKLDVLKQTDSDYWDFMQNENTPRGNGIYYDHQFLRIIHHDLNLLKFIQQISQDLSCKTTLTAHPSFGNISCNNLQEKFGRSIPVNQNPLLTLLARPEFQSEEFDGFIKKCLQIQVQKYANLVFHKMTISIETIQPIIFSYRFGDSSTLRNAGLSDAPDYIKAAGIKLLALVEPHITLITLDQQA